MNTERDRYFVDPKRAEGRVEEWRVKLAAFDHDFRIQFGEEVGFWRRLYARCQGKWRIMNRLRNIILSLKPERSRIAKRAERRHKAATIPKQ